MAAKYKLIYFNIQGAAEHIRYIFAYADQEYEDVRIKHEDWSTLKPNTPYGKLPVLEIDGKPVSQSNAIARYLAKQFSLAGKDDWESLQCDILADTLRDLTLEIGKLFYAEDEAKKEEIKKRLNDKELPFYLGKFNQIASDNSNGLLVGSQITWVDLAFAQFFEFLEVSKPGTLKSYPALDHLVKKIHSIPSIKAWVDKRPPNPYKLPL